MDCLFKKRCAEPDFLEKIFLPPPKWGKIGQAFGSLNT